MQSITIFCFASLCLAAICSTGYALPQDVVLTEDAQKYLRGVGKWSYVF